MANQNYMEIMSQISDERFSGYPQPQKYDQHYINKYAYPKGLKGYRRTDEEIQEKNKSIRAKRKSLYDI